MRLSAWLAENDKTDAWLAQEIGRERSFVTKLRNGRAVPSFSTATKIHKVTAGAVTANDFMPALPVASQAAE